MNIIELLKKIVEDHQFMKVKFIDGSMQVDAWTANAMITVYNSLKEENQTKFSEMIKKKNGFIKMANFAYKNTKVI